MRQPFAPDVIPALIRRHAEDAAFYWLQHDASGYSPRLSLGGLERFSNLLAAHLEGIEVAGDAGWQPSLAALQQWKQTGEAFVCAHTALQNNDPVQLDEVMQEVGARPDELLRSVISALAWVPRARALDAIANWSGADSDAVKQVAALRAAALMGQSATASLSQPIKYFLTNTDAHVRSAACRAAAVSDQSSAADAQLRSALQDPELAVRAEAAIALGRHAYAQGQQGTPTAIKVADTLWHAMVAQVDLHNVATGWYSKQTLRRLNRWVQHLAWLVPLGNSELAALLAFMPPRVALRFVAYHGDPAQLPFVIAQMADANTARYAGWVWQAITGVDIQAAGLALAEPEPDDSAPAVSQARLDADLGVALPNVQAIAQYSTAALQNGQRYLQGKPLSWAHTLDVLEEAPQALRSIAAMHLQLSRPATSFALRGPVQVQQQALNALRASA
jgi:uncharacterized protein (TIGR02270 family)